MTRGTNIVVEKELVVIGTGMAGMAAALFALKRGIDTAQIGMAGQINFSSGLIDLMGVHPVAENRVWLDPWAGISALTKAEPDHPYAHLAKTQIQSALADVFEFLAAAGIPYHHEDQANQQVLTPLGTIKTTYAVPHSMVAGVAALEQAPPCLIIDFNGLKGFSAAQIVGQVKRNWPKLCSARIAIPRTKGELYTEHIARSLETKKNRLELAEMIKPHLNDVSVLGIPAVLGISRSTEVIDDLRKWLGVNIFEIPTMMPAITGLRLREAFENRLPMLGLSTYYQQKVTDVAKQKDGRWLLTIGDGPHRHQIITKSVVLASGRFLGKGLHADRTGIRETIFNLSVDQPADRSQWHQKDLLHSEGHPINRCGLPTDQHYRPVTGIGKPVHSNLFAAGSILAGQDWIRQKCGSGLAIATAWGAVEGVKARL